LEEIILCVFACNEVFWMKIMIIKLEHRRSSQVDNTET
jgi:hypothetical protein